MRLIMPLAGTAVRRATDDKGFDGVIYAPDSGCGNVLIGYSTDRWPWGQRGLVMTRH